MSPDPLTLYKLIILYMLDKVNFPLTSAQISEFVLGKEYTSFLTLQQAIHELKEASLLTTYPTANRTLLEITAEGSKTLHFFKDQINNAIKEEIHEFFLVNEIEMRNESSILANYYKSTSGEYEAHLVAREGKVTLVDITLSVPTREAAAAICDNWQKKNQEVYEFLTKQLF